MSKTLSGSCLCGEVQFTLQEKFSAFYQCHCKQCQQLSGTAFASNLFTKPDNITWTKGEASVLRFEHETRSFSRAFCKHCGSALPVVTKSKRALLVPAGSLNEPVDMKISANIFTDEEAHWLAEGREAKGFTGFPE